MAKTIDYEWHTQEVLLQSTRTFLNSIMDECECFSFALQRTVRLDIKWGNYLPSLSLLLADMVGLVSITQRAALPMRKFHSSVRPTARQKTARPMLGASSQQQLAWLHDGGREREEKWREREREGARFRLDSSRSLGAISRF